MNEGTYAQEWPAEAVPGDAWRHPDTPWELDVMLDVVGTVSPSLGLADRALSAIRRIAAPEILSELLLVQVDAQGALKRPQGQASTTDLLAWVLSCLWGPSPSAHLLAEGCSLVRVRREGTGAVAQVCIPLHDVGRVRTLIACSITTHSPDQVRGLADRLTLVTALLAPAACDERDVVDHPGVSLPSPIDLTPRQKEILTCMAEGMTNRQIAARICFSESTVRLESMAIYRHFGVHSRSHAVAAARASGELQDRSLSVGA